MSHCRRLLLTAAVVLPAATLPSPVRAQSVEQPAGQPRTIREDVADLRDVDFSIREAAQRRLTQAREGAFDAVLTAAADAGEAGERAVQILSHWAFGPAGGFAERCERALYELSDTGESLPAVRAAAALSSHRTVRVERGVASLRDLGAVLVHFDPYLPGKGEQRIGLGEEPVIVFEKPFDGGNTDLWQLRRFSEIPEVSLVSATRSLDDAAVAAATANLTGVKVTFRGGALGIGGDFGAPCVITSVTPGEAADQAGLAAYDVVLKMNDTEIGNFADLVASLYPLSWDDEVVLRVQRGRVIADVDVSLGRWADLAPQMNRGRAGLGMIDRPRFDIPDHWRVVGTAPERVPDETMQPNILLPQPRLMPPRQQPQLPPVEDPPEQAAEPVEPDFD